MEEALAKENMLLKAYVVSDEIDLNRLAARYRIPKKYTWEEPLILGEYHLKNDFTSIREETAVFIFSFGSVVFVNFPEEETERFVQSLKDAADEGKLDNFRNYSDDYEIRISNDEEFEITDEYVVVPADEYGYLELVAMVIAKSVALEKIEAMLDQIGDKVEEMIDQLEQGKTNFSNKQIAKTTSDILRFQYTTISYIMILDKPDSTWDSSSANDFYDSMAEFFELNDRYEIIRSKLDILSNIKEGFTTISFSNHGLKLEWGVIFLIIAEVIIMLIELFK